MKKCISVLLVLTMLFASAFCGMNTPFFSAASAESDSSDNHYPVALTDQAGRQVVIEQEPQRLISSYYITTSLLMALDLDERLVGVEEGSNRGLHKTEGDLPVRGRL